MPTQPGWRRLADFKQDMVLARIEDLDWEWIREQGWTQPVEALRPRWPRLAGLLEEGGLVRLDPKIVAQIQAERVPTLEVGYFRGNDGLRYAERGPEERFEEQLDVASLAVEVAGEDEDAPIEDGVDALLRVLSEELVSERAVLLAALAPSVGPPAPMDEAALDAHEALDPGALPRASDALVDAFAQALARRRAEPSPGPGPSREQRRVYVRKAGAIGAFTVLIVGALLPFHPAIAVIGAPVIVLCAIIIAVHTLAR